MYLLANVKPKDEVTLVCCHPVSYFGLF